MAEYITHNDTSNADSTCNDKDIREKRGTTYTKLMWGPRLSSISQLMAMFGGPMLGAGLLAIIGLGGAAVSTTAIAVTAIGAVLSVASIITNYIGSSRQNEGTLDQTEMGAMTNARYLVKELKANNMCLTNEHEHNCRKDGKKWAQTVQPQDQIVQSRI